MTSLHIGVSGVGSIGLRHTRLLADRPDVTVTVFDRAPGGVALPATVASARSFEELLESGLDGLVVATPDAIHAAQCVEACRRGIPVLVEKPVADSVDAALEVQACARQHDTGVLVGYVLRHYAVLRQVRDLLADGALGTPVSVHQSLGAYETLRLARNRFTGTDRYRLPYDYSHEWDYLQWLLGPVTGIAAVARLAGDRELRQDPNVINGLVTLESGVTGTFHLDYVSEGQGRQFEVVGDRATMRADLATGLIRLRVHGGKLVGEYDCAEPRDVAFARQLEHFLDMIRTAATPVVTVADGIRALRVADAVVAACEQAGWYPVVAANTSDDTGPVTTPS